MASFISPRIRLSISGISVFAFLWLTLAPCVFAEEHRALSASSSGSAGVKRLIADLSSSDYRTREDATRQLSQAGPEAVGEIAKAAVADDLEVAFRAVHVLQAMSQSNQPAVESQAAAVLEQLASQGTAATADLAADALELYRVKQQERAIVELRRLGAEINVVGTELPGTGSDFLACVIAASKWRGGANDFALLKLVPNLYQLSLYGVRVDEEIAGILAGLHRPASISLFGTEISEAAYEKIAQKLPNTKLDRRGSGLLGIEGALEVNECEIKRVRPGTAAAQAGLLAGDKIISLDDHPIQDFHELTRLIAEKQAGEIVAMKIRRDDSEITKNVTLGQWQ